MGAAALCILTAGGSALAVDVVACLKYQGIFSRKSTANIVDVLCGRNGCFLCMNMSTDIVQCIGVDNQCIAPCNRAWVFQAAWNVYLCIATREQCTFTVYVAIFHTHINLWHQHGLRTAIRKFDFFVYQPNNVAG